MEEITREETIQELKEIRFNMNARVNGTSRFDAALTYAIEHLEQEPCDDAVSRQAVDDAIYDYSRSCDVNYEQIMKFIDKLPPVTPMPKMGRCKDCKYFECDSVAKVDGIPLIVAHEICSRWGNGCKTKEDGYCFLFEPKTQEMEE